MIRRPKDANNRADGDDNDDNDNDDNNAGTERRDDDDESLSLSDFEKKYSEYYGEAVAEHDDFEDSDSNDEEENDNNVDENGEEDICIDDDDDGDVETDPAKLSKLAMLNIRGMRGRTSPKRAEYSSSGTADVGAAMAVDATSSLPNVNSFGIDGEPTTTTTTTTKLVSPLNAESRAKLSVSSTSVFLLLVFKPTRRIDANN